MNFKFLFISLFISHGCFYQARADDWGCQVLLCMSDPRGPTTEKECIPPMEKLWRHLAKGGSFPTCELVDDIPGDIKTYFQQQQQHKVKQ